VPRTGRTDPERSFASTSESAALLVDEIFPEQLPRQWVLGVPYPLRFLFTSRSAVMGGVLDIVHRCIALQLIEKAADSH
jgi:hypothetical protein